MTTSTKLSSKVWVALWGYHTMLNTEMPQNWRDLLVTVFHAEAILINFTMVDKEHYPQGGRQQGTDYNGNRHVLSIKQEQPRNVESEVECVHNQHDGCDENGVAVDWSLRVPSTQ